MVVAGQKLICTKLVLPTLMVFCGTIPPRETQQFGNITSCGVAHSTVVAEISFVWFQHEVPTLDGWLCLGRLGSSTVAELSEARTHIANREFLRAARVAKARVTPGRTGSFLSNAPDLTGLVQNGIWNHMYIYIYVCTMDLHVLFDR